MKLQIIFIVIDLVILLAYPIVYLYHQVRRVFSLYQDKRK
jgi:hypothetical protein